MSSVYQGSTYYTSRTSHGILDAAAAVFWEQLLLLLLPNGDSSKMAGSLAPAYVLAWYIFTHCV